ncbi:MAG: asparagine synthase (glutamine-hydrolyzing) [Lachnospiraceae bacterium]|nr:asparagine synthase (glutamine-hydrolyzing) [Lachnospiraceae bacterium]
MCGIAGFIREDISREETIKKMNSRLQHRGPDAEGFWMDSESGITLGHKRLSIVDLSENGAQPMHSADGRYVIVFNGEIYNAPEIKKELKKEGFGATYRGTSDTEVLLNAFSFWGIDKTVEKMKGMFALALYDRKERCLSLIRDRVGEKPLFYGFYEGAFAFASELQALRELPGFTTRICDEAVAEYIRYGYVPAPMTIYADTFKLLPGCILQLQYPFSREEIRPYWSMREVALCGEQNPFSGSFEEATEQLEHLLKQSVKGQLMSDVPLGAYLSGGIDSATVVSLMQECSSSKVKTFTIGFYDKAYNEAEFAKEIAAHLGTEHTELYVGEKECKDVIPLLPGIYGEPFADSSQIPTYLVSKLAKSKVTVSLSGDAGDELFCGYTTYSKLAAVWKKANLAPKGLRHMAGGLGCKAGFNNKFYRGSKCLGCDTILQMKEALGYTSIMMERLPVGSRADILKRPEWATPTLKDEMAGMMLDDMLHYHPDDILVKVDRAGMAVSLENRIPMLDKDVVEFAWSLPTEYKYDGRTSKKILKEVLYRYVPKEMMDRPKKGFSVPLTRWLTEGDTAQWAQELMLHSKAAKDGILRGAEVEKLWKGFLAGKEPSRLVWTVLMLEQWYRECNK